MENSRRQQCPASEGSFLVKGANEQLGVHRIAHLVTKNPPGTHILDGDQVEPALLGSDVGQIGNPELVNRVNGEVSLHEIIALLGMTIWPRLR